MGKASWVCAIHNMPTAIALEKNHRGEKRSNLSHQLLCIFGCSSQHQWWRTEMPLAELTLSEQVPTWALWLMACIGLLYPGVTGLCGWKIRCYRWGESYSIPPTSPSRGSKTTPYIPGISLPPVDYAQKLWFAVEGVFMSLFSCFDKARGLGRNGWKRKSLEEVAAVSFWSLGWNFSPRMRGIKVKSWSGQIRFCSLIPIMLSSGPVWQFSPDWGESHYALIYLTPNPL